MNDPSKTIQELIEQNTALKKRVQELERFESAYCKGEAELHGGAKHSNSNTETINSRVFKSIIDHFPYLIYAKDPEGRFLFASRSLAHFFGQDTPETLHGKTSHDFLPQATADQHRAGDLQVMAQQTALHIEETVETQDGLVTFITTKFPLFDNEGKPYAVCGVSVDITEHQRIEKVLRENEDRLKDAHRIAHLGSWELDLLTDKLIWSEEIYRIFEIDPNTFGASYAAFLGAIHPADRDAVNQAYTQSLENRQPYGIAHRLLMSDGRVKYVQEQCETYYTPEGKPLRSMGTVQDITERKQAEQLLAQERERLSAIIRGTNVGTWEWNVQTGESVYNPRWAEIIGYTLEELSPVSIETWMKFAHPGDLRQSNALLKRHFTGELDYYECESRMKHKNGAWIWVLDRGKVASWTEDGKPLMMFGTHQDITNRKQAEADLRASERKYRTLIEQMPDMIWQKDIHGGYVSCNSNYAGALGVTIETIAGHRDDDFYQPELAAKYLADDQAVITTGQPLETEELWEEAGEQRWLHTSKVALLNEDGHVIGTIGMGRNITERKQTEKVLKENEERLRTILRTAQDGFWLVDASTGRLVEVNDAAASMLGYTVAELLTRGLADIDVQWSPEELYREMQKVKEQGNAFFETRHCTKGGQTIDVEISVNYMPANDQFFSFIHNISKRKRAEEELKNILLFNKHIIDSAQEGIIVYDCDLRYQLFNPFMEKLSGLQASDVIGKTPSALFPFLEECGVVGDLKKVLRGEKVEPREFQDHIPKSGRSGWVIQTNAPLLDSKGEIIGIVGMVRDITEQKRTTEQLHQAQKMESVGRLAGGVAHDFNNMLGVILGHTEIALDQADPAQPLHADLEEIRNATHRSAQLIRQLLAFARKQTMIPKVLDLNETVDGMLKMLRRLIGEDIHLTWFPDPALWPLKVDPSQIDQIMANLCVNARDAIQGVGKVTIETRNICLDKDYCADHAEFVPGEYVQLCVSDDGCGMDKEVLDKIFEPFFTTKGLGKGTGLGLATVYGIVKQNNGFINAYSELGQGTTFRIYLPRHTGQAGKVEEREPQEPIRRGHETILLVEDDPSLLKMNKLMLEAQGYRVLTAGTPGEVIRLAEEYPGKIDLLMTDVVMPEMNGRDLARKIMSFLPHLKCLFTSGYTANVIAHHGVLDEGVHFIQKPFSRRDLAAKVREVLDQ